MELNSKVVLITGSATNIGEAIALKFAKAGASVIVNAKSNVSGGMKVAKSIESAGGKALFIQADVSDPKQVDSLFERVLEAFGTVDVLVNNAGAVNEIAVLNSTKEDWLQAFDSNFFSSVLCSIAAAKIMKSKRTGRIINMASIRGIDYAGRTGIMPYSAAKAALISFTKTLAKELAPDILVNAVAPGYTLTTAFDNVPESRKAEFVQQSFIKRWLTVEEVADAFLYLAGADGITGEVLVIDGGYTLK